MSALHRHPVVMLRRADYCDTNLLWRWRNDYAARQASRNRTPVPHDQHALWLMRTLNDPTRALFIGEEDGVPVGTVRLDRDGPFAAEVSVTVASEYRGLGYGAALVTGVEAWAHGALIERLVAEIRWSNWRSLRLFWRCGYRLRGLRWGFVTLVQHRDGSVLRRIVQRVRLGAAA